MTSNCCESEPMCSNCDKNVITKLSLCGFNDWCEECDTSLWSTRDETTTTTTNDKVATNKYEELDYCEECYKTVRDVFLVDVNIDGVYLVNDNRPKGAKWCTQECLDSYNGKHPIMAHCKECYSRIDLDKIIEGLCKLCYSHL